jgi:hypothetical protein
MPQTKMRAPKRQVMALQSRAADLGQRLWNTINLRNYSNYSTSSFQIMAKGRKDY